MAGNGRVAWPAGWRIAIRLARRDIQVHRGRSALVMTMIALPVALMVFWVTSYATSQVSVAERPEAVMGSGAAQFVYTGPRTLRQSPDGSVLSQCDGAQVSSGGDFGIPFGVEARRSSPGVPCEPATPIPGLQTGRDEAVPGGEVVAALTRLVGAPVVPYGFTSAALGADYGYANTTVLVADARDEAFRGMVDLTSGRWPENPREVVVTESGAAAGLPTSGDITSSTLTGNLGTDRLTVVGTATAPKGPSGSFGLVIPGTDDHFFVDRYIVTGSGPFTWEQVGRLNDYGLLVVSRAVLADPPGVADRIPGISTPATGDLGGLAVVAAIVMLVVSSLIAGPAFAVMASRQRRVLALVAANGAAGSALRQSMLAQALLLGAGAIVLGVIAGLAAAAVLVRTGWRFVPEGFGPFEVPVWSVLGIAAVGVLACVVSAVVPARRLGELEVARALAGEVVAPAPRRSTPLLGGVLLAVGVVLCVLAVAVPAGAGTEGGTWLMLLMPAGISAVVAGALMLVPTVLVAAGRLGARLPVTARMAARDASRLRGRATSTVAAVMAGAIALSSLGLLLCSQDEYSRRHYIASAPFGFMQINAGPEAEGVKERVEAAVPGVIVHTVADLGYSGLPPTPGNEAAVTTSHDEGRAPVLGIARPGCDPRATSGFTEGSVYAGPCVAGEPGRGQYGVVTASPEDAAALFGLDAAAVDTLRQGGAVVPGDPSVVVDGRITLLAGEYRDVPDDPARSGWLDGPRLHPLPAVVAPPAGFRLHGQVVGVAITPQTARGIDRAGSPMWTHLAGPSDTASNGLSDEQAAAINRAAGTAYPDAVERGYQSSIIPLLWLLSALFALLTLVATLTATALAMGEARRDLGTLAAVGASAAIRRRFAAWQAGGLALLGTVFGLLAGAVPGVVLSLGITGAPSQQAVLDYSTQQITTNAARLLNGFVIVPWPPLLAALVAVPLVAAVFGALFAGRPVDMTRRGD